MTRKIAIAVTESDLQSVHRLIDDLAAALRAQGCQTHLFPSTLKEAWAGLAEQGVRRVVCYGGGIGHATQAIQSLRGMSVTLCSLDHPVYWLESLQEFQATHVGQSMFTFPTQSNLALVSRILGQNAPVSCLRHSAPAPTVPPPAMDDREHDILLVGSHVPPQTSRDTVARQAPMLLAAFDAAVVRLSADPACRLEDAVAGGFDDPFDRDRQAFTWLSILVDRFIRAQWRIKAVQSLAGHRVTLIGKDWNGVQLPSSVTWLGARNSAEAVALMSRAKIVVNTVPPYYESHERLFDAAAAGAALVTARNAYTATRFRQGGALVDTSAEIGDICAGLLADHAALAAAGQANLRLIATEEGWPQRVAQLMALMDRNAALEPDVIVHMEGDAPNLNLSISGLSAARSTVLNIRPDQQVGTLRFFQQAGGYLPEGAMVTVVTDTSLPLSGFFPMAQSLESMGFLTVDVTHGAHWAKLNVRKCRELSLSERAVEFGVEGRRFSLTYPSGRDILRRFAVHGQCFYEMPLLQRFRRISQPGMVLDVGANIGNHAVYAAALLGRKVVAFEPHPQSFACLLDNIRANHLDDRIDARAVGVGKASGRAGLGDFDPANSGATRLHPLDAGDIEIVALDDLWPELPPPVAILKIDVEGMEGDVLSGAQGLIAACRPVVFAESWNAAATDDLTRLMTGMGYACQGKVEGTEMLEFIPLSW